MAVPDIIFTKQLNIVANKLRGLLFFEGEDFCYNYKTQQWTKIPAYNGFGLFSINSKTSDVGLVVFSAGSVDLQEQTSTGVAQTAKITTGESNLNQGGRALMKGVRPLVNGGTVTVRVGTRNDLSTTVSYSTSTALTSRTGFADFRDEGRYHRTEVTVAGGFNTILGAELDFEESGQV